jgi:class 3 adenylate cyclase/DNA-binding winged helix-turn-helix (wHTH) protein
MSSIPGGVDETDDFLLVGIESSPGARTIGVPLAEFRILGPLEFVRAGRSVEIPGFRQRALLARLLLDANRVIPRDRLIDDLWGETPPDGAANALQAAVSRLRRTLGDDANIRATGPGYGIEVDEDVLDVRRFERLREEGIQALASGDPAAAASDLRAALSPWRGAPLADFAYEPFAQGEIARLEEARLGTLEKRIECDLALGAHTEVTGELERLVLEHPLREAFRSQLVLALYRSGRQADALDAYRSAREVLAEELGIDPGPDLRELHERILRQDASLAPPTRVARPSAHADTVPASDLHMTATAISRDVAAVGGAPEAQRKERKFVTALFADLVGSTTLGEREDPEVVQSVVGRAFDRLAEEIARYEGLLEKFIGDALLAVFGVPRAHEDDAERAVRAALEMQAAVSELNRGFAAEGKPTLEMRIGIEAGEVLVDVERASSPRDRMVTGAAVNTAARLQAAAQPAHILVGSAVFAGTKEIMEYRELEPLAVKGKAEPVRAWRALRIKARTRGERPRLGFEARLIGRDDELAVLKHTLRRVESEKRPALVTIAGSAGVGKSRLVAELERHVRTSRQVVYWRRGRCLAYGNMSYSALADAIKTHCEILEDDPVDVAAEKADAAVRELFGDEGIAPQIRALVGAGEPTAMSREELFEAWRRFLEHLAARHPLVVILEDIHWADDGLLDFVEHVADWAEGRITLLATARTELFETRPTWGGGRRNAASIYIDPLSRTEADAMLDDLLSVPMSPELSASILERSEGNPLYVEEIVRKLIDDGVLRTNAGSRLDVVRPATGIQVPRSVQAVIAARLDGLPDEEKITLQNASVIGRVFWLDAVAALTGGSVADVRGALGRLRVKELVVPHDLSSFSDDREFSFRHNLIRDGAYDLLPKASRADKHERVATWAHRRAGDRADEIPELIATHLLEALRYVEEVKASADDVGDLRRRAFIWTRAAAQRTAALWQRAEATRWFGAAERLADATDVGPAERAELGRMHADVSYGTDPAGERVGVLQRVLAAYEELRDPAGVAWARSRSAIAFLEVGRYKEAETNAWEAVSTLEPSGESDDLANAMCVLGDVLWRRGRCTEAEPILRRSVDMATRVGASLVQAEATQTLGMCLGDIGRTEEAIAAMHDAYRLAKEVGEFNNLMRVSSNLPVALADLASDFPAAEAVLLEGLELARRSGAKRAEAWLLGNLADVRARLGHLEEAERLGRASVDMLSALGDRLACAGLTIYLAQIVLYRGRVDEAEALHREVRPMLLENPEPQGLVPASMNEGYIALARSDFDSAVVWLDATVERLRTSNVAMAPQVFTDLARLLVAARRRDAARAYRDIAAASPPTPALRANVRVIDGLLEADPNRSRAALADGIDELDRLGLRIDAARAMIDLARAIARVGENPEPKLVAARDLLVECDAGLFLPDVYAALAELSEGYRAPDRRC